MTVKEWETALKKTPVFACASIMVLAGVPTARADTPGQPFTNIQPSIALTEVMTTGAGGVFPSFTSGGALGDTDGFVYDFAGNYAPSGSIYTNGQLLPIAGDSAVFSLVGTTYGGNGTTNFAVPNLIGQAIIGAGAGAGLPVQTLGVPTGSATTSLTVANLPPPTGSGLAFSNIQPSLPLVPLIATSGSFPSASSANGSAFIGQIANYAGSLGSSGQFTPNGWAVANGALLPIAGNTALFSVLGTTYGGDGVTDFALPNLLGRIAVGADAANPPGTFAGQAATTLTTAQLPPGGAPVPNGQPSMAVNFLISTQGIFPSQGGVSGGFSQTLGTVGQIIEYAGPLGNADQYLPAGYLPADGSLLPITDYEALYNVIGTTYGGDGITTFALPNLDGRTVIGADGSTVLPGFTEGVDQNVLTADNIPTATSSDLPEPASLSVLAVGLMGSLAARRRRTSRYLPIQN
jgi:microcystin-dependent protein